MVDEELRQGLMKLVAMVGMQIVQGAPVGQILQTLEDERTALEPVVEAFRRVDAEAWFEKQGQALKPKKPRRTQGWIRRNGMARRAAKAVAGSDR